MKHKHSRAHELGDFTTDWRVIPISLLAVAIGLISTVVAWALLRLIGIFTNLFYYHRWNTALTSPAGNHAGRVGHSGADRWIAHHRLNGPLWL